MLGRKQSVRNNEDWKNALDHIEETVSKKELDSLVKKTVKDIKEKCKGKKAAYAWSAGKDSLVLGEICEKAGIDQSVLVRCNLEYPAFIAWIEQNKPSGLEIINTGQDMEWLKKHPDMLFPDKSNKAAQWFHIVQHRGQARYYKEHGKARAAVVLPDNVLFADGEGERIREDLMNKCSLHTVLRLPTGIFYAQGVKTNVLFFTRGTTDKGNTKKVWFYDLRTNMPSFGKTNPLKAEHFDGFKDAYTAEDRKSISDERWSCYTYDQISEEGKNHSLDLGLIKDDSVLDYDDLPDPIESGEECIAQLEEAVDLLMSVVKELKALEGAE